MTTSVAYGTGLYGTGSYDATPVTPTPTPVPTVTKATVTVIDTVTNQVVSSFVVYQLPTTVLEHELSATVVTS